MNELDLLVENYFTDSIETSDLFRLVEQMMVNEARNTAGADINEIMFGYFAAGSSWDRFVNAEEAEVALNKRKGEVLPTEWENQIGRAKAMIEDVLQWANENGWEGEITRVWWTARPGVLSRAVGKPVSSGNPTDILLEFGREDFLGISAKSTKGKADIGFKNPGALPIANALNLDIKKVIQDQSKKAIEDLKLPSTATARKKYLRVKGNELIKSAAEDVGRNLLNILRELLYERLNNMEEEQIRNHITTYWLDAGENYPYYIKVTGRGTESRGFSASISDPVKNENYKLLMSHPIEVVKVGSDSIGVMAGGKRIMKMRFKYESQKLASSLKMSGDPWK